MRVPPGSPLSEHASIGSFAPLALPEEESDTDLEGKGRGQSWHSNTPPAEPKAGPKPGRQQGRGGREPARSDKGEDLEVEQLTFLVMWMQKK